ncbi:circularly permuted type 2 ATP-grasp protein [Bifidobacterium mongoliense]|uniref:circularly permuted type 2 ATP-grasp protein n=1 Tax=Bifidobacterium mongoliense TaxID=518643 RepID=UPI0026475776|nr:circularly permuted type 2 ATP-grasp protein [Bifidobacterium mongoliense]MDN6025197.1 circularly permuted type 2 ATP-grasp protein [Bifidobacterium mongoliense]MDN6051213.1 circularly permuted type 2 ATP-grasp protein [Bifidobacterium mongoliense]
MLESVARELADALVGHRASINRELSRNGVRFGISADGHYEDRLFPYDPIPRIIESDEFSTLERGLAQRVNALNACLRDLYSDKAIVKDGVIPEEYVYTSKGYFPQVNGVLPPGGVFAHIAGEDLVQGEDGQWWVLEDNLRIPSGASYPLFVRDIELRISPTLFRDVRIRDNRAYPRLLRKSMDFVSTEGIAVVLTPGRQNAAFFEHSYLAEKTGAALAFPEDLEVVDNRVFFVDYAGKRHRVGVIYRRLADEFLDPFAFNPDSVIGIPGVLAAYRSGNVAIMNAPGNGVADDKAMYYFVPEMIRYYLHEEPILHNAPTYMPMFEKDRKVILDRLGELVIKDVAEAGGYGVVFGSSLGVREREEMAQRIVDEPRRFIAQEVIPFKDIDIVDPATGQRTPRKADLRAFVLTGQKTHVWYSGLTRYSARQGQMIVNSSQGGGFKDTWVLAPPQSEEYSKQRERDAVNLLDESSLSTPALVTATKADNLYWLGRYSERVFTTISQFSLFYDLVMDTQVEAFKPFAHALDLPEDFQDFDTFIHSFLYDDGNPDSVRSAVHSAFNNAVVLRPELGSGLLQYVELAVSTIDDAAHGNGTSENIYRQRDITDHMLSLWGGVEDSALDPVLKAMLFIGKYLERIDLYSRFTVPASCMTAPLKKLAIYLGMLDGMPLPQGIVAGIQWLLEQLPLRGYGEVTEEISKFVIDPQSRVADPDVSTYNALNAMNMDAEH